jgi:diaminopimelate decarboxylase
MNPWWANEFVSVRANKLVLGGQSAERLAAAHGAPLFVYGRARLEANYRKVESAFREHSPWPGRVFYAVKANPNPSLLRLLKRLGASIDAVSPGEVRLALETGFPPERILFTGTSLSEQDLEQVMAVEGLTINIDAEAQLERMARLKRRRFQGRRFRVSVRWNPGLGLGFDARAVTAGGRSTDGTPVKFGVEGTKLPALFRRARELGFLPAGLHQHIGSGWTLRDYAVARRAVRAMAAMAAGLVKYGIPIEFIDFGGGFSPRYRRGDRPFPVDRYVRDIAAACREAGLAPSFIGLEPGKFLAADAGVLLLRVEYLKESFGNLLACVSGGTYNTVPRPVIYERAYHEIVNASRVKGPPRKRLTVAGNLCETGDVFGVDRLLPVPRPGDILAVLNAGAYCRSMASSFNLREIPKEIVI